MIHTIRNKILHGLIWFTVVALIPLISFSQTPRALPSPYASTSLVNYVRTWDAAAPETNPNTLITRPLKDVKQVTQYLDGLGRPLQTVIKQGSLETTSGTGADIISAVEYDAFGREPFKYLPTPSTATDATKNDGSFKLNPFAQQAAFYNDIQAFKKKDADQMPAKHAILFIGSSSFTKWTDVQDYFPDYLIINRGFRRNK